MPSNLPADHRARYQLVTLETGATCLQLTGSYTLISLNQSLPVIAGELAQLAKQSGLYWDLTNIHQLDYANAVMLWQIWGRQRPDHLLLRPEQEKMFLRLEKQHYFLNRYSVNGFCPSPCWASNCSVFGSSGRYDYPLRSDRAGYSLPDCPSRQNSCARNFCNLYRTGAQALGITAIVGFLIGIVLSYLSSEQLHMFGADVYIVNILGMSIIRELGPMLAAILVAGRSGSAMTAQLGVMRVTEELDALTVMGIPHSLRLVLPKIIGLGFALPLIVLWTSAVALIGGFLAAELQVGLSIRYALTALPDAVPIANLWLALGKGVVCGMAIALIACHFGLRIKPNTESLGEGTTNSVVTSITAVIIIDAILPSLFPISVSG